MKRILCFITWILTVLVLMISLCGCTVLKEAIKDFKDENPQTNIIPVDEDKDGTIDVFLVDADQDGVVDLDEQGKPIEVPQSRVELAKAGSVDAQIAGTADSLGLLLGLLGIPGAGALTYFARKWGAAKPTKQLTAMTGIAKDVVITVQNYRDSLDFDDNNDNKAAMDRHLKKQDQETIDFVKAAKKGNI